ncbi:hypothetical protein BVC80_1819g4 [Macleaya cordata]|uniref:Uncharacterized protein n=1 Tax=Macleaya cordata TaxID=56857 RepID=A0A200QW74_MACCD|nr:hypothetical protein BVC80_1819g4 [Macleaya cordata]
MAATKPLTSEAIALTEKKMDMTLDEIIKMSKKPTTKVKKQRVPNKGQKFFNAGAGAAARGNPASGNSLKVRQFMDSRSSVRQGALAQRRSNFQGNHFSLATEVARKAAAAPTRNRPFNRSRPVNWNKPSSKGYDACFCSFDFCGMGSDHLIKSAWCMLFSISRSKDVGIAPVGHLSSANLKTLRLAGLYSIDENDFDIEMKWDKFGGKIGCAAFLFKFVDDGFFTSFLEFNVEVVCMEDTVEFYMEKRPSLGIYIGLELHQYREPPKEALVGSRTMHGVEELVPSSRGQGGEEVGLATLPIDSAEKATMVSTVDSSDEDLNRVAYACIVRYDLMLERRIFGGLICVHSYFHLFRDTFLPFVPLKIHFTL